MQITGSITIRKGVGMTICGRAYDKSSAGKGVGALIVQLPEGYSPPYNLLLPASSLSAQAYKFCRTLPRVLF
jgi:hypothetical protein